MTTPPQQPPEAATPASSPRDPRTVLTGTAITVWLAALIVYIVAILGRTSFGVAGVEAIDRFEVDASRIAVFTAVQVGVYALAQIPTGLLIDRLGPRVVLVAGALAMAVGQILLAVTASYPLAVGARILIGAGDATAFLSVMRILPFWFPLRWAPLFTQLTGGLGQIGQFLSAVPFLALLHARGWTPAFLSIGALGVLVALVALVAVADAPGLPRRRFPRKASSSCPSALPRSTASPRSQRPPLSHLVATVLKSPVCWHGFFIHYVNMVPQVIFTMLWGVPLMTLGMGLSPTEAGLVLSLNTTAVVLAGPLHGLVSARLGASRDLMALACTITIAGAWIVFLSSPVARGLGAIIALNILMGALTSSSNYGFDYVRERLDRGIVATGTGLANMGGFVSSMVAAQAVGIMLDVSAHGTNYTWADFRFAWWAMIAVWAVGIVGLIAARVWSKRRYATRSSVTTVETENPR